ncbi:hypothetical protein WN867_07235 [Tetragenococcus halophilus]|uniref:50S ribosomal protein L29 n=1 Tax=Tetragenococcus halophilus TaxID=51669 RepID=A0A3G5FIW3_TETHA|nr:hypothetical protein [Tetragenococcus halophilus]AYW50282.1 hypothetical protein C7H83_07325 [Tetragenococcus halophilus]MDN6129865.1 hypothetical protein [Tetragenococcus halophilus]MDN6144151.1 hypothetical protein [Tetragenococcus halophilus]MDN6257891.1 hypothetical protein [Tetragenococcus halophilus]MDN6265783.1 hypothetical protein [Tetragenococcus halophilus]
MQKISSTVCGKKQKEMTKQIGKLRQQVFCLQLNEKILLIKIQRAKAKENLINFFLTKSKKHEDV